MTVIYYNYYNYNYHNFTGKISSLSFNSVAKVNIDFEKVLDKVAWQVEGFSHIKTPV